VSRLEQVAVGVLEPAPDNPRRNVTADAELVDTIKSLGVLEPLVVSKTRANGYTVIAGHRRLAAAKAAGLDDVPCIVHDDLDDRTRAEMMLVENLQRADLSPLEEAGAYRRLIDLGAKQRDLAKVVGRSQSHISKRTALLKLPEAGRAALDSGGISIDVALDIAKLPAATAAGLFKKGVPRQWDVESAVRKHEAEEKAQAARKELEKAGVRVVDGKDVGGNVWDHMLYRLGVDEAAHASEPCHAATVEYGGRVSLLCLEPARHEPDGASEIKAAEKEDDDDGEYVPPAETAEQKKARLERERTRKAEVAAQAERQRLIAARQAFAATIVEKASTADVVEVMAMALASNCYIEAPLEDEIALTMVGVEVDRRDWSARTAKATAFLDESERNRTRFVLATAFSAFEHLITSLYEDDERSHVTRYIQWLVARGYEPTDVDREWLPDVAAVDGHAISIEPVGRAKPPKKYRVTCSCGDLDTTQTTEAYARERHATHLADVGAEQG
jgi:ParB/RepB/Spo0J family partition protein